MVEGACMAEGMHGRGHAWQEGSPCQGGMCDRGASVMGSMQGEGACVAGETATAADGMHPTGMHSCLHKCFSCLIYRFRNCCVRQNV